MATRKSGQAALYELMGARSSRPARPVDVPDIDMTEQAQGSWLSPGRVLRLPVGYVLLASALAVALVVTAYVFGFRRAADVATNRFEQDVLQGQALVDPLGADDQLDTTARPRSAPPLLSVTTQTPVVNGGGSAPSAGPATGGSGWGPDLLRSAPGGAELHHFDADGSGRGGAGGSVLSRQWT